MGESTAEEGAGAAGHHHDSLPGVFVVMALRAAVIPSVRSVAGLGMADEQRYEGWRREPGGGEAPNERSGGERGRGGADLLRSRFSPALRLVDSYEQNKSTLRSELSVSNLRSHM
jgi:hypothetical protein